MTSRAAPTGASGCRNSVPAMGGPCRRTPRRCRCGEHRGSGAADPPDRRSQSGAATPCLRRSVPLTRRQGGLRCCCGQKIARDCGRPLVGRGSPGTSTMRAELRCSRGALGPRLVRAALVMYGTGRVKGGQPQAASHDGRTGVACGCGTSRARRSAVGSTNGSGTTGGRLKTTTIAALARKLLVAFASTRPPALSLKAP